MAGDVRQLQHDRTLIVANHEFFLDGLLLAIFLPVDAVFLVHTSLANHPVLGRLLRYVVAGAGRLAEEVRRLWLERFGIRVLERCGVTECAPVIAEGGVLQVRGPNVMKGYVPYDRPGVIPLPQSIGNAWHSAGDVVSIDADDFLHIRGRVRRFAKIAGEMVSLEVVEQVALSAAPGALGVPELAVARVLRVVAARLREWADTPEVAA